LAGSMDISMEQVERAVAGLRPFVGRSAGDLTGPELLAFQAAALEIRRAGDVVLSVAAGEIGVRSEEGAGRFARQKGFSNAGQLVAGISGMSPGQAHTLVELGKALTVPDAGEQFPLLGAAFREQKLGVDQADLIRRCLASLKAPDLDLERRLVALAAKVDLRRLRQACLRAARTHVDANAEEAERRARDERYLRFVDEADGMVGVHGRLDAEVAAPLRAYVDANVRQMMQRKRDVPLRVVGSDGPLDPPDTREPAQMAADALAALARWANGCECGSSGVKTTVVVRVDKADLEAGVGFGTCDSLETPISVGTLRRMAIDAQILPVTMGGESLPLDVGRAKRLATEAQRIALGERDGGCAWCCAPASYCDVHHIDFWGSGGATDLRNLVMLCVGCHHRLHDYGWGIEADSNDVWLIPPARVDPGRRRRRIGPARLDAA